MGNTALGFRKAGFVAEILYRMCVCVFFEIDPCRKFNGPKIWDPVNRTKREEALVAGKIASHRTVKLYRQLNKRKTVLKLICLLCYYVLNAVFVEHGWDLCLCWLTFYFAGRLKCIHERKMT